MSMMMMGDEICASATARSGMATYLCTYCLFGMKIRFFSNYGPLWTFDGSLES